MEISSEVGEGVGKGVGVGVRFGVGVDFPIFLEILKFREKEINIIPLCKNFENLKISKIDKYHFLEKLKNRKFGNL